VPDHKLRYDGADDTDADRQDDEGKPFELVHGFNLLKNMRAL